MNMFRLSLAAVGLLVAVVVAACAGGGAAASVSPPADADVSITAKDNKFDPTSFTLPAGEPVKAFFRNLDGQPHNVAIYTDSSAAAKLFVGEVITNAAATYEIPALTAGQYVFRCDVHLDMTGTVTVGG